MNYKIINEPEITDEEINAMMDFRQVLEKHKSASSVRRFSYLSACVGLLVVVGLLLYQKSSSPIKSATQNQSVPSNLLKPKTKSTKSSDSTQSINNTATELPQVPTATKKIPKIVVSDHEQVNARPDIYIPAEPIEGYPHLYEYLNQNLKYPNEAAKDSIQGVESVAFVIDKNGKPSKIEILHSLGPDFDKEVLRILEQMPRWKPATLNAQPVPSKVSLPFTFRIKIQ